MVKDIISANDYGISGTNLFTDIAFDAFFQIDGMNFVRFHFNSSGRASLGTFGATNAVFGNGIMNHFFAFPSRAFSLNMCYVFRSEIL